METTINLTTTDKTTTDTTQRIYQYALDALENLAGQAVLTPLLESPILSEQLGFRLLVKAENLQNTGSFKFRGAFGFLSHHIKRHPIKGVVAYSSGNHAQAVSYCARRLGIPCTIVMPKDAPQLKIDRTIGYGAHVVFYDREHDDREAMAMEWVDQEHYILLPPYDDEVVMGGQGTIAFEIIEQCKTLGVSAHHILVPCSGGGLAAGCAVVARRMEPSIQVHTVEPEEFEDAARSIQAGELKKNERLAKGLCDSLTAIHLGRQTFPILLDHIDEGLVVSDQAVQHAMKMAFEHFKIVLEPGGSVGLAAALSEPQRWQGKTVVAIASGGNVDHDLFTNIVSDRLTPDL